MHPTTREHQQPDLNTALAVWEDDDRNAIEVVEHVKNLFLENIENFGTELILARPKQSTECFISPFRKILDPAIPAYHTARKINVYIIVLKTLPPIFHLFQHINTLHIDSFPGLEQIPDLSTLHQLEVLKISNLPHLRELPPLTHHTQLRELFVEDLSSLSTVLPELPEDNLTSLKELMISDLPFRISHVVSQISIFTSLEWLSITDTHDESVPDHLHSDIGKLTNLKRFELFTGDNVTCLPESMSRLTNLTVLTVFSEAITEIPECFSTLTNLTEIDLQETGINPLTLPDRLISQFSSLSRLALPSTNQSDSSHTITFRSPLPGSCGTEARESFR